MVEYLRAANIKPSVALATGLFYAIKVDTNNFKKSFYAYKSGRISLFVRNDISIVRFIF